MNVNKKVKTSKMEYSEEEIEDFEENNAEDEDFSLIPKKER